MTRATLFHRVEKLEKQFPAPRVAADDPACERWLTTTLRRLSRQIETASNIMSAEEQGRLERALNEWNDNDAGPLAEWLTDLSRGRSQVPKLSAEAMRSLLLAWLSPERGTSARVCRRCGLEYPDHQRPPIVEWELLPGKVPLVDEPPWYDLPDFFTACPGCGTSLYEIDWAHLIPDGNAWCNAGMPS